MFPAVVIDLGTQTAPAEAASMLEACNAAVVTGTCELDTPASEPGRALAIVRWLGSERQSVRIEVGLREADRAAWSVRELVFSPRDPARERWRSVGLVLATLVGEVEAAQTPREKETGAPEPANPTPAPSPPGAGASSTSRANETPATEPAQRSAAPPSGAKSAPAASTARAQPSAEDSTPVPARAATRPALPVIRPSAFIAAGVLAGPGADFDPLRVGGGLRGGWISAAGWVLSASADYSHSDLQQQALEADWFRIAAGAGYRQWWSERWSWEVGLEFGARAFRVVPNAAVSIQSTSWSPQGALHAEIWWQALAQAGAWAGVTASSIGRETRLLGPDDEPDVVLPLAEIHVMLGIWWAP
jgi:hypothetical protein